MENNENSVSKLMDTTLDKIRNIVDVDTVVGTPVSTPDGVTIIPVSRVSYAFAAGGSDFRVRENPNIGFGGGNGAGVRIEPVGFLIIKDGSVRMINVTPPAATTVDRVIEKAPEIIELVEGLAQKYAKKEPPAPTSAE